MLVIAVVAIIVVGPKDLPGMMRTIGKTIGKVKRMASDFQGQIDDAIRESDIDEVTSTAFKPLEDAKKSMENFQNSVADPLEAHKSVISDELTETSKAMELGPETAALKKEIKEKAANTKAAAAKRASAKKAPPKKPAAKAPAKKAAAAKAPAAKAPAKKTAAKKPAPKRSAI